MIVSTQPQSGLAPQHSTSLLAIFAILGGLVMMAGGLAFGLVFLLFGSARELDPISTAPAFAFAAVGVYVGWPLFRYGVSAARGQPGRLYAPARTRFRWLLVILLIALGQAVLSVKSQPQLAGLLLPLINFLALSLPPVLVLAYAGRRLPQAGLRERTVWGFLSGGATLGIGLAMVAELLVVAILAVLAVILVQLFLPAAAEGLRSLGQQLQQGDADASQRLIANLLLTPAGLGLVLLVTAGFGPLIEEFAKALPVALLARHYRLSPSGSFLAGVACGAGFALIESLLYGAFGISEWVLQAGLRPGAAIVHTFGSGLVGWGWGEALLRRRPSNLAVGYLAAVGLHAAFNTLGTLLGLAGAIQENPGSPRIGAVAGLLTRGLIIALIVLSLVAIRLFLSMMARLRRSEPSVGGVGTQTMGDVA